MLGGNGIAQTVARAGDGDEALAGCTGFVIGPTHGAGDKIVAFAVVEDHGDGGFFHRVDGCDLVGIKMAEQLSAQPDKGVGKVRR